MSAFDFENGHIPVAYNAAGVTPSDSSDLPKTAFGLYVGQTGDVKITTLQGLVVTFEQLASGVIHPIAARRVWASGTSATGIVAVW